MEVIFVDWAPIKRKSQIRYGAHIRRYYAWITLNKIVDKVIPFRKENGNINWQAVINMFKKESKIWLEYGCGGVAHFFVLLASFIRFRKTLILNVHDFVMQQKDTYEKHPLLQGLRLQITEQLLLKRANVIILPSPGLLNYFKPRKNQKVIIMPPGVGEDELSIPPPRNVRKNIKTAIYFGSMRRKGIIPEIIKLFSALDEWELLLVGQKEGAKIEETKNVKYLGVVSHEDLNAILECADVVLIPLPKREYFNIAMHMKLGYALKSCKPVITTKLRGILEYMSLTGLEKNVIYVEKWDLDSLKEALQKALNLNINADETIKRLRTLTWEPRFRKAIMIAMYMNHRNKNHRNKIEWI